MPGKIALIAPEKTLEIEKLQIAFREAGITAPFLNVSKLGMYTREKDTQLIAGKADLKNYMGCLIHVSSNFTQFIEPFLDELTKKGVYSHVKPEFFYVVSNTPFLLSVLNSRGIPIPHTIIVQHAELIESVIEAFSYPILCKTFQGTQKLQSIVLESPRSMKSFISSLRSEMGAISIQEYLEGDMYYAAIIGEDVYPVVRKWNAKKFEHEKKPLSATLTEEEIEVVRKAARIVGTEIATVKLIQGKVSNVRPWIEFEAFDKALGKDLYKAVVQLYKKRTGANSQ